MILELFAALVVYPIISGEGSSSSSDESSSSDDYGGGYGANTADNYWSDPSSKDGQTTLGDYGID